MSSQLEVYAMVMRLSLSYLIISFEKCESLILNEYIEMFPATYFIKVYFHYTVPDNLGPSKIPLTLLKTNRSEEVGKLPERWCKFYPTHGSFIGFRSENTVNLVITDLKPCYKPQLDSKDSKNGCKILSFVGGRINDGQGKEGLCTVNGDKMYTLVLAEESEQKDILSNVDQFCSNFNNAVFPYFFLVFDNSLKGSSKAVCYLIFPRLKKTTAFLVLWCEKRNNIIEILNSKNSRKPHLWVTRLATKIQPFGNDPTVTWYFYFKEDVDEVLYRELIKRGNTTALSVKYLNVYLVWATIELSSNRTRYGILIHAKTTQFLSCFSKPKLTFSMYVTPFRKEVWILIGACCSLITILTSVYNKKLKLSKSFSPFFFFVSTLVEEPYSVPTSLWNNRFFKTLTLTWLLTAIIFTNLYVGLMISDVTTPLQGDILSDFDQVLDTEKVYAKMSNLPAEEIANYWRDPLPNIKQKKDSRGHLFLHGCETPFNSKSHEVHHKELDNKESFTIMQIPLSKCGAHDINNGVGRKFLAHPWMYYGFQQLERQLLSSKRDLDEKYKRRLYAFFSPQNQHYPKNPKLQTQIIQMVRFYPAVAIEKELMACERSILMGDTEELLYELSYLKVNYPNKGFYLSKETFETGWSTPVIWSFSNAGMSRIPMYFQLLVEAGIRNALMGLRKDKHYLIRRAGSKYVHESLTVSERIGMEGSIQTIFIILVLCLSVASVMFMKELLLFKFGSKLTLETKPFDDEGNQLTCKLNIISMFVKVFCRIDGDL
jgi:hypothetical protein